MAEIRIDPLSGMRVIVHDTAASGFEAEPIARATPDLLLRPDAADPPPWQEPELFTVRAARGTHELLAHAAQAVHALAELEVAQVVATVEVWRERMRARQAAAYVHLGVDEQPGTRSEAGLLALDFVPAAVARERERFGAHAVRTMGANLLEDLVASEVRRRERIVAIDDEAVLLCPYASRDPFQLMLVPRRPRERFEDDGPAGADLLHRGLRLLQARFGASPPLSLWVRTAPRGAERFCWRIDVAPCLRAAGALALGTGLAHNPVAPERAAAELRDLLRGT